jgi:hypothetical protein
MFAFSKRSRRRFSRGEANGTTRLWARMCDCRAAWLTRNGWARILGRVGLSSGVESVDEINDFASALRMTGELDTW